MANIKKLLTSRKVISAVVLVAVAAFGKLYDRWGPDSSRDSTKHALESDFIITHHGKCRMNCRKIDLSEVTDVYNNGRVNARKSDQYAKPCPIVSKEKRSSDGQLIRVVMAECPNKLKVVTVIDLENKYKCKCR